MGGGNDELQNSLGIGGMTPDDLPEPLRRLLDGQTAAPELPGMTPDAESYTSDPFKGIDPEYIAMMDQSYGFDPSVYGGGPPMPIYKTQGRGASPGVAPPAAANPAPSRELTGAAYHAKYGEHPYGR